MFTVYKARTAHLAAEKVISEIKGTGRHIVIAPDPFTLAVEKTISAKLGKKGFFNIEVMSFARLASVLLGDDIAKCLSPAGSVMLMEKVILREQDRLLHYRRAANVPGFASELYAAVTAIRNSGVTPEDLRGVAQKIGKAYVGQKTEDIALLYGEYLKELETKHTDSTTRLEALTERILESEDLGDVSFYVVDHIDLNAKQMDVVAALTHRARNVLVAVSEGADAPNNRIYPKLYRKLCSRAVREKIPLREVDVPCALSQGKKHLAEELFSYSFTEGAPDDLRLREAKDPEEEVTLLATEIISEVRKTGRRYAEFAVITPSFEKYLPVMERIFRRYEIPFFADRRLPLSSSDLFRHILLAMELPLRDYDKRLVQKYVLHSLFEETDEEKERFADYVDKSGVDRSLFRQPFLLFREDEAYPSAEKVRADLMREIAVFAACPARATVTAYAEIFRKFLSENDYDEKVKRYYASVSAAGLPDKAEVLRQVPQAIMELLDELAELRGEEEIEYSAFIAALKSGALQVKIASLPVSLDCVYFAPVKQAMYAPIPCLYVLGAEEGLFPLEMTGEGILGNVEYHEWQMNGITIENIGVEELAQSRFHTLQLLLRGDRVALSHVGTPSPCFGQIEEIFGIRVRKCSEILEDFDIDVRIPTRGVAEALIVDWSRRYHEGILTEKEHRFATVISKALDIPFPCAHEADTPEYVSKEYNPFFRKGVTSISALENYFTCPFMHFVKYGLGAQERVKAVFDQRDNGTILHECLKRFLKYLGKRSYDISDEDARSLAEKLTDEILAEPRYEAIGKSLGSTLARVKRRAGRVAVIVKNHLHTTDFRPSLLEKSFPDYASEDQEKEPEGQNEKGLTTIKPEGVALKGRIDRVDLLEEDGERFAVAYDYKTGSAEISTDELYFGKKIQLHVYLAILEASGYTPSAALYYKLYERRSPGKQMLYGPKREDMITHLDRDITGVASPYTGISIGKDGQWKDAKKQLLSEETFRAQIEYACDVAAQAIREIKEGYIYPTTIGQNRLPCEYCDIRNVCRHAGEHVRSMRAITAEDIYAIEAGKKQSKEEAEGKTDGADR